MVTRRRPAAVFGALAAMVPSERLINRALDVDETAEQVDVAPPQGQQLAASESRAVSSVDERYFPASSQSVCCSAGVRLRPC